MTPREKAIKLINSFMPHSSGNSNNNEAKQCALIAVDEILNNDGFTKFDQHLTEYWQEVKQELLNNLRNKNYVGRKIKGFKFEYGTDTIVWNSRKEKYIGKIGLIVNQYEQFVKVKFDNKQLVYYPISMIEENLLSEELKLPKKGEEILVSNLGEEWTKAIFLSYIEDAMFPISCVKDGYEENFRKGKKVPRLNWSVWKPIDEKVETID